MKNVLIVEQSQTITDIMKSHFDKKEYNTYFTKDGHQAYNKALKLHKEGIILDAIIADMEIQKMPADVLIHMLRIETNMKNTHIIYLHNKDVTHQYTATEHYIPKHSTMAYLDKLL